MREPSPTCSSRLGPWRAWLKYETAFRFLPPASLDRRNGLLCYNVVKLGNQGGGSRLSRPVVGLSDPDGRAIGMIGILHHCGSWTRPGSTPKA
jgi:hypothetical protein